MTARPAVRRIALLLVLAPLFAAHAEVRLSAGVDVYESIVRADGWRFASAGVGSIGLAASGSRNVRGELALSIPLTLPAALSIDRAYVRVRLPWFRMTLGAAPLSWGEGLFLNAGDLPEPSYDASTDLLTGDFRSASIWQAAVYVPLGAVSFVEAIALPDVSAAATLESTRLGARVYIDAGPAAFQAGYLSDDPYHRFYASVQANLGIEWYLSLAQGFDATNGSIANDLFDSTTLSVGAFHTVSLPADASLSLRAEALVSLAALDQGSGNTPSAALIASLALSPSVALGLNAIALPLDPSALVSASISWNVDQGLTLLAVAASNAGATGAVYAFDATGSPSFTLGARYRY